MYNERDLIIKIKFTMSNILTNILNAQDKGIDLKHVEDNLIVDLDDYPTLIENMRYLDESERHMLYDNFKTDLNYTRLLG